ncbi:MAG: ferrous iron transporter B, partial [Polyangiales bacterium]
ARAVLALSLPHELEAQAAFCDLDVALLALHTLDPAQRGALAAACITARYRWVDALVAACLPPPPPARPSRTARLDGWLTHPLWGTAFFVCIMGLLFSLLFTGTEPLMQLIELGVTRLQELAVQRMPPGSLRELLADGVIGGVGNVLVFLPQITALFLAVQVLEDSGYLARVVVLADGLLRRLGLQGRAFVPFLAAFACAVPAVLATRTLSRRRDRLLVMMTLPLTSCSARLPVYLLVLATVFAPETRVLGVLPVSVLWLGGLYALSLGAALIAAAVLQRTLLPGQAAPLVIELPSYRLPHLGTTWRGVWVRVRAFLLGAGTLILAMTILLWALMYFPRPPAALGADAASTHVPAPQSAAERAHSRGKPSPGDVARPQGKPSKAAAVRPGSGSVLAAERVTAPAPSDAAGTALAHSYAGRLGRALGPLWVPLGFDWRLGIGIIAAFSAREVFVSTLAIVFGVEGDDAHIAPLRDALRRARKADGTPLMTPVTGLALMVFFLFCCQCMSTLAVVYRESGALRWPVLLFVYMTGLAYALAWLVRQIGLMWGFS